MPTGIAETLVKDAIGLASGAAARGDGAPAMSAELFDNGGMIDQGFHLIEHRRKTPDRAITDQEWKAIMATKSTGSGGGVQVRVTVPEREGMSREHLGTRIGETIGWEMMKAGI